MTGHLLAGFLSSWPVLIPTVSQIADCLALLVVAFLLVAIGAAARHLAGRDQTGAMPEADLLVGWVLVAGGFTLCGVFTGIPFTALSLVAALAGLLSLVYLVRRRHSILPQGAGPVLVLLAPIILITLSQVPSQNDDFATWLPNLRYLAVVDHFPGAGRPVSDSAFPAYPYSVALIGYLAGKIGGGLAVTAVNRFNLLLLACLALLLGRVASDDNGAGPSLRGWRAAALALGAVTILCPAFVPGLVLSNYCDTATSVCLAFASVLMVRVAWAERRPSFALCLQTVAACVGLILSKQANLVLLALLLAGIGVALLPRIKPLFRLVPIILAVGPFYLAWRLQSVGIANGEHAVRPMAEWTWSILPQTLSSIGHVCANKGGYFGLAALLVAWAGWWRRKSSLVTVFAVIFLGYTLFLIWVYVAAFTPYEGRMAASFWRYHTQLGALEMVATAAVLTRIGRHRFMVPLSRALGVLCILVLTVGPVAAFPLIRFDISPIKDHVREASQAMAPLVPADARLLVADPDGNGFFTGFVRWYMGFRSPVQAEVTLFNRDTDIGQLIAAGKISAIYVISSAPGLEKVLGDVPPSGGTSLYLKSSEGQWGRVGFWPFVGFSKASDYKY